VPGAELLAGALAPYREALHQRMLLEHPALGHGRQRLPASEVLEELETSLRELKKPVVAISPEKSGRRSKITELVNLHLMKAFLIIWRIQGILC